MSRVVTCICGLLPWLLLGGAVLACIPGPLAGLGLLLLSTGVILAAVSLGLIRAGWTAGPHAQPEVLGEPPERPGPGQRSTANGERLTREERGYIWASAALAGCARCPDCGGILAGGPEGGASQNAACRNCGSEFNIAFVPGDCWGERISEPGPGVDRGRNVP